MFITTANTLDTVPRPLLDRMEVIELGSYTDEEKLMIAKNHLIPKQLDKHGIRKTQLRITDDAIREIISCYTRESGVRNLERSFAEICRKTAMQILEQEEEMIILSLTDDNGVEQNFEYLDVIEYEGKEYLFLLPVDDENAEVVILEIEPVDEENENYLAIEDMELLEKLYEMFKEKFKDYFTFED